MKKNSNLLKELAGVKSRTVRKKREINEVAEPSFCCDINSQYYGNNAAGTSVNINGFVDTYLMQNGPQGPLCDNSLCQAVTTNTSANWDVQPTQASGPNNSGPSGPSGPTTPPSVPSAQGMPTSSRRKPFTPKRQGVRGKAPRRGLSEVKKAISNFIKKNKK